MEENQTNNGEEALQLSKTRRKKEMHALQEVGEQLVQLDVKRLNDLGLPETLMEAILEAKRTRTHGGLRRQMQFIGKLMRNIDAEPIRKQLGLLESLTVEQTTRLHLLERWRERLLTDERAIAELGQQYPAADLQHLRTLTRNALKERLANKPPKSFRALFQELQKIIPGDSENTDRKINEDEQS